MFQNLCRVLTLRIEETGSDVFFAQRYYLILHKAALGSSAVQWTNDDSRRGLVELLNSLEFELESGVTTVAVGT